MHCKKCVLKVTNAVSVIPNVSNVRVNLATETVTLESAELVPLETVNKALKDFSDDYEAGPVKPTHIRALKQLKAFLPLIISVAGVITWTLLWYYLVPSHHHRHIAMQDFMAGFFFVFGGLKALSWKQFPAKFASYDILAAKSKLYANLYPGIELGLGILYITGTWLALANIVTILVMGIGAVGIYKALQRPGMAHCACLGGWFSIPLTNVTLIENLTMTAMAILMLLSI